MLPTISIIVANYNYALYLPECLKGILSQTFKDYELIIIDDASTDHSLGVIHSYIDKHPNIRLIQNKKNQGIFKCTEIGLDAARGKYILFTSSDDVLFPTFLEKKISFFHQHPNIGLCCSKYAYFFSNTPEKITSLDLMKTSQPLLLKSKKLIRAIRKNKFWIPGNTTIVRKDLLIKSGGFDKKYASHTDWFVFFKIGFEYGIGYIPETLAAMRKHEKTYSSSVPLSKKYEVWQAMLEYLNDKDKKDLKKAFMKSHSFYNFGLDFYAFMLKFPKNWRTFSPSLWMRFLSSYLRKKKQTFSKSS